MSPLQKAKLCWPFFVQHPDSDRMFALVSSSAPTLYLQAVHSHASTDANRIDSSNTNLQSASPLTNHSEKPLFRQIWL